MAWEATDHLANPRWLATFLSIEPSSSSLERRSAPQLMQLRVLLRHAAEKLAAGGFLSRREILNLNQALNVPVWQS